MEIIFQWLHTGEDVREILSRYISQVKQDKAYLTDIVMGVAAKKKEIEEQVEPYLKDRKLDEVSQLEFALLLVASYEMMFKYDVPYRVVINEALDIIKEYGAQDSFKFINSVLDHLAKDVRGLECKGS